MSENNKIPFSPVRGHEENIRRQAVADGYVYFATDTGNIYVDAEGTRHTMGGSGSSGIHYTNASEADVVRVDDEEGSKLYTIPLETFETPVAPKPDDLLLNSDGRFFRVISYNDDTALVTVTLIAVSGSGGGGGGVIYSEKAKLNKVDPTSNYLINGSTASIDIYAISGRDMLDGSYLDEKLTVYWTLSEQAADTGIITQYAQGNFPIVGTTDEENPVWEHFEYGTKARFSTHNILKMYVKGSASEQSREIAYEFFTSELQLLKHPNFSNVNYYSPEGVVIYCTVVGATDKVLYYYFENNGIEECLNPQGNVILYNGSNATTEQSFTVPSNLATHGSHKVRIELYQYINGKADLNAAAPPIEMEIAVAEAGNNKAIIWLGDYQSQYYEYDSIKIPFRVYDPTATLGAEITLFKDSNKIGSRTITDQTQFSTWEIVDGSLNEINHYSITCGVEDNETRKDIQFTVVEDPNRAGMKLSTAGLRFLFDASGRSNSESRTNRAKYSYTNKDGNTITAKFENFNWYNNGWVIDQDTGNTCLRVSNGAVFSVPLGQTRFATSNNSAQSHTFEFQFKVRNVQDYSNIVHNITRYKGNTDDRYPTYPSWNDEEVYQTFNNKSYLNETWSNGKEYDNYDAFLQWYLPAHKEAFPDSTWPPSYDDIEYRKTDKLLSTAYAAGKYYDGQHGICIGAQDALFTNGVDTVNVSYVEDKLINLTIVYSHGTGEESGSNKLMSIYLNGMLTGVARSTVNEAWSIGDSNNELTLVFDSKYCDFDLYKIRVYNQPLTLPAVLTNYTVDLKDPVAYDLSQLAVVNNSINESQLKYENMIAYNAAHPDGYIMPYMIFTTKDADGNVLPYSKSKKIKDVQVEFVNTGLERAYATGELGELAERANTTIEDYYIHHCPSWIADHVEMSVQGTSSEFYPRRNYKAKTKTVTPGDPSETKVVQMYMNRGPFTQLYASSDEAEKKQSHLDWFYYDNNTVGTTKFTLKIDYMESSGTYNMGFANLVKNAYTHHPLKDYYDAGAFQKAETEYTQATTYENGTTYWYVNHKGNWKNTVDDELKIASAEDFALGPVAYAQSAGQTKVCTDTSNQFYNKWYTAATVYVQAETPSYLNDYRTSVQGFPVLAFHQTTDAQGNSTGIRFIGRYNMLLDKGSDEAYGFKPIDEIYQKFVTKKGKPVKVSKVAECWEAENNSRGFCSFRDASTNRTDDKFFDTGQLTAKGAPIVADYWEYRYHDKADSLDVIYDLSSTISDAGSIKTVQDEMGVDIQDPAIITAPDGKYANFTQGMQNAYDALLNTYSNWERAVRWVYSTDQDAVPSAGTYEAADVGVAIYAPDTYYILDAESHYVLDTSEDYDAQKTYYTGAGDSKEAIKLCDREEYVYAPNTFYISTPLGDKVLDPDTVFNSEYEYFIFNADEAHSGAQPLAEPVTYNGRTYNYDTKEYRNAKFTNDLSKHFNIEYLVTYFIMTEVFECYDSRGKNAMFGSWGPQQEGGDYIWYPMFYDIDTQLGINNTGIPSFEYYVDATENGTFSTNDSILWNNLYKNFRSQIIQKYRQLRGKESTYGTLTHAPLQTVDRIEKWYLADPTVSNSIAMKGERPLIAFNLDEYFKYISITNAAVGYQDRNGGTGYDNGTYFYALQGDRSLSRQQFLTNRFNYIDSWLNQGNYERGGTNIIRGRIAANSPSNTSDKWIEGENKNTEPALITNVPYWTDSTKTKKTHMFDGEYWITMEPVRNSYVTVGTDTANFPSLKYTNIEGPVKFETPDLENGVRTSGGYHEQLYYVYGLDQMKSLGDMSKLYWTEFNIEGSATKMTDLLLGYDGLDENSDHYANDNINMYGIHASNSATDNGGMPLLKKVNMSYIKFNDTAPTYNFASCEKLEDFRAIGSNITNITFADGVALQTLYLPETIKTLNLVEATKLNNIVTQYVPRQDGATPPVDVTPGLYIPGLTEPSQGGTYTSKIEQLSLIGDCLGYDSYVLLNNYYQARSGSPSSKVTITEVDWSPYKQIDVGTEYDADAAANHEYWLDDGHYGFKEYTHTTYDNWNLCIKNGELYRLDRDLLTAKQNLITDAQLLLNLKNATNFISTAETNYEIPIISGIIFINNESPMDEVEIQTTLASAYPNLKLFFANVTQHPAAKYVVLNDDGTYDLLARKTLGAGETRFPDPTDASSGILSSAELDRYDTRSSYDFYGWSTQPLSPSAVAALPNNWYEASQGRLLVTTNNANSAALLPSQQYNNWNSFELTEGVNDYTFYAVFGIHKYVMSYYLYVDENGNYSTDAANIDKVLVPAGEYIVDNPTKKMPYRDDTALGPNGLWKFIGWGLNPESTVPVEWTNAAIGRASRDRRFYPIFTAIDVHDEPTDEKYFTIYNGELMPAPGYEGLKGKITLPNTVNGVTVTSVSGFSGQNGLTHVFVMPGNQITTIGQGGFTGCTKLQYFEWPETLEVINANAFMECGALTSTDFSHTKLRRIGSQAFRVALAGDHVNIYLPGSTLKEIGQNAFTYLNNATLETITFGSAGDLFDLNNVSYTTPISAQNSGGKADQLTYVLYLPADVTTEVINQFLAGSYRAGEYTTPNR